MLLIDFTSVTIIRNYNILRKEELDLIIIVTTKHIFIFIICLYWHIITKMIVLIAFYVYILNIQNMPP